MRRLFRRFDDGECEALRARGEGEQGGPPTTKSEESRTTAGPVETGSGGVLTGRLRVSALLEALERRLSGGGVDDMLVVVARRVWWRGERRRGEAIRSLHAQDQEWA
jgi:hypothetical protein